MRHVLFSAGIASLALAGCASDSSRLADAHVRPTDRVECLVSSSTDGLPRDEIKSAQHERCHPDEALKWTSGQRDTIKPDFRRGKDD